MTAEVEVLEFLRALVATIKPEIVGEADTFLGVSTFWIAEGPKHNGFGKVISLRIRSRGFREKRN